MSDKLKIVGLKMENVKRIEALELQFDESNKLVEITGANGAGKTSFLDGIKFLFSGAKGTDAMPVRDGQEKGMIEVELKKYNSDGVLVETGLMFQKKFNPSGPTIKIYKKEGVGTIQSSQQILDTLYDAISFDPLAFAELSKTNDGRKKQVELIKKLTGLNFSDLEEKYVVAFKERAEVNKEVSNIEAKLAGRNPDPEFPANELSAVELIKRIQDANKHNSIIVQRSQEAARLNDVKCTFQSSLNNIDNQIKELQESRANVLSQIDDTNKSKIEVDDWINTQTLINTLPIQTQLQGIEDTNKKVRENNEILKLQIDHAEAKALQGKLDNGLIQIKDEKQSRLAAAKMPIPGMSFNADGISINGVPFEQVNDAEKLKTSVAMAMALNPVLRVILIKNGSLLDKKNFEILKQMATDNDYTIFLERVDETGEVGIVIEEGKVFKNNYETTIPGAAPAPWIESTGVNP